MAERIDRRTRLRGWLVVALGAHGALAAWTLHRSLDALAPAAEVMQLEATEIEVEPGVQGPTPLVAAEPLEPTSGRAQPLPALAMGATSHNGTIVTVEPSASAGPPAAEVAPDNGGTWSFSATGAPASSALSGVALGSAVHAGVRATVAESMQHGRVDPLHSVLRVFTAREIELGLIPGDNLVGLTRDRVRIGLTATNGHAVLQFHIDGAGVVASANVVDAASDRADWDDVVSRIVQDARSAPPAHMPSGAHGVTLTLDVDSSERSVSGSAPTKNVVTKALRAINDPIATVIDGKTPLQRVVAVRVVDVQAF